MKEEPRIVAFLCNWCSYAGADLAGMSRITYPPSVRPIRVMCSGRVDPGFILRALEMGADGVLVSGCHPGDCHYVDGNLKAEKRVENTKKLLDILGLEPERLRLEWISASEGTKFAQVIKDFTEQLRKIGSNPLKTKPTGRMPANIDELVAETVKETNIRYCLECGKCSSSCPVARLSEGYSPRRMVEKFLLGFRDKVLSSHELWTCLTCYQCSERCPSDVKYPEFIRTCRTLANGGVLEEVCAHRGVPQALSRMMTSPKVKQNRMGWLPDDAKIAERGDLLYFVGCLPYFDVMFENLGLEGIKIAQSVVKILNRAGIKPVIMPNEKCCGHDLLWTGDIEKFEELAKINVADIKETGASRVVLACPEGYRTFRKDYPEVLGDLGFEVLHITELLSELIEKEKLKFDGKLAKKVVYHDPCRLGRHMGVYDPPRSVISSIPGVELVEMERNRENAECCGVNAWLACGKCSKEIQLDRLMEAKNTGADLLVTTCPKCQIHWKCVMTEKVPNETEKVGMEVRDLTVLVAEALNLK